MLHELLGFLRKALSQQATVREALYCGLLQVLQADPGETSEQICGWREWRRGQRRWGRLQHKLLRAYFH